MTTTSSNPAMAPLIDAVRDYVVRQNGNSPFSTAIDGLTVLHAQHERNQTHLIHKPALCIVLQGAKQTIFGDRQFHYQAGQALVVTLETPGYSRVLEGEPDAPYLSIVVELDPLAMRKMMGQTNAPQEPDESAGGSAFVIPFEGPLIDCALRAIQLLDEPRAIPVLYPLLMQEICYWLLRAPNGAQIARLIVGGGWHHGVVKAMQALREHFARPIAIKELAALANLSPSAFHRHFKELTSFTPLQYQKQVRLLEARRMMISDAANAQTAALTVGYESTSQFNREYLRMFGAPPKQDILRLKHARA